jgi:hypothetical protein
MYRYRLCPLAYIHPAGIPTYGLLPPEKNTLTFIHCINSSIIHKKIFIKILFRSPHVEKSGI